MGAYEAGLDAGGHDAGTKARLLAQSALWRNVYIAESSAQAEDELAALLLRTRAYMMHVRAAYNPADFTINRAMLNPWADPAVGDDDAVKYVLATGALYGSPARVRDQVAELWDAGVQHLLCQTGFGDMSHEQNLASMRRFGDPDATWRSSTPLSPMVRFLSTSTGMLAGAAKAVSSTPLAC